MQKKKKKLFIRKMKLIVKKEKNNQNVIENILIYLICYYTHGMFIVTPRYLFKSIFFIYSFNYLILIAFFYFNSSSEPFMPMIPLGLKETKEVNFTDPFSDFILEHYSENSSTYEEAIADITDTRQAARTPTRDFQGIALLFRYYNLLYFVERRFFPPDRSLGIYFEWYDSLTGVPSCQRTVAFEKACILFNLGAIYTQIGAKQDRSSEKGLDSAVDNFLRAAGVFKHILETFTNAPSMDLKPQVLEVLVSLMLAQARECIYEKLKLQMEHLTIEDYSHVSFN